MTSTALEVGTGLNWLLGFCAVVGNVTVLIWRLRKGNNERCSILSMLIVHLAFFDLICGAQLIVFQSLMASSVLDFSNGTISHTAHILDEMCFYLAVFYIGSVYTSDWITLSIAVYSIAIITPWRVYTTRVVATLLFLVAWLIFSTSVFTEMHILHVPNPATPNTLNTTPAIFCTPSSLLLAAEVKYIFIFECVSAGLVTICGGLYLLVFIPRIRLWRSMHCRTEAPSWYGLHGRLLAIVLVNALRSLVVISLMVSCLVSVFVDNTVNVEECKINAIANVSIMTVPSAINPLLYTVGTPKFIRLFSRLRSCVPYCKCSNNCYSEPDEQQSLLGLHYLCHVGCIICYTSNGDSQSFSTEDVQSSKLFTESSEDPPSEISYQLSVMVE